MGAATVLETVLINSIPMMTINKSKPLMRVCFSFAAYAKNLIDYLKSCNVPVEEGLTEAEFSSIESNFGFTFPPDLRSVLQEGLPVGSGFPNWRLFSVQQLQILTSLPILGLCKEVGRRNFWLESWGERPVGNDEAVALANGFLKKAPVLVPIYKNFYIPSSPCLAGNPVFYVYGCEVKLLSFDISGFFQRVEFKNNDDDVIKSSNFLLNAPAWAATEPRRIEFWTELVERGEERVAAASSIGGGGHWWWWSGELGGCLEQVFWKLRNGGWKEEEVREMLMMNDRDEQQEDSDPDFDGKNTVVMDREFVMWHMRLLSNKLLRAGWSSEDVMDSLGFQPDS